MYGKDGGYLADVAGKFVLGHVCTNCDRNMNDRAGDANWLYDVGVRFTFGKYSGQLLQDVAEKDRGYLLWMLEQDFLPDTKRLVEIALQEDPIANRHARDRDSENERCAVCKHVPDDYEQCRKCDGSTNYLSTDYYRDRGVYLDGVTRQKDIMIMEWEFDAGILCIRCAEE